jgi:archaemetzincin
MSMNEPDATRSRRDALTMLAAAAVAIPRAAWAQGMAPQATPARGIRVSVQPLGRFDASLYEQIASALSAELSVQVQREPSIPLPREAYYPARGRYRADALLNFLRPRVRPPVDRVIGVTEVDISTTAHGREDWGVLGLGDMPGPCCVVSRFRCRRNARDAAQVLRRMVTTCVHEVGHTLGLEHCPDTRCLMTDARGTVATVDQTDGRLCNACRARLSLPPR